MLQNVHKAWHVTHVLSQVISFLSIQATLAYKSDKSMLPINKSSEIHMHQCVLIHIRIRGNVGTVKHVYALQYFY